MPPVRLGSDCRFVNSIPPMVLGDDVYFGAATPRDGFARVLALGLVDGVNISAGMQMRVQESDDGETWVDVPGATSPLAGSDDDNVILGVDWQPTRRLVRAVCNCVGLGLVAGVALVLYGGRHEPVSNTPPITVV